MAKKYEQYLPRNVRKKKEEGESAYEIATKLIEAKHGNPL
jgi:hypothetical protein